MIAETKSKSIGEGRRSKEVYICGMQGRFKGASLVGSIEINGRMSKKDYCMYGNKRAKEKIGVH